MATKALRLSEAEKTLIRSLRRRGATEYVAAVFDTPKMGLLIQQQVATATPKTRTFFSHKAIKAGKGGYPCTAAVPCSRKLSTAARASVHATTQTELQKFGHAPDFEVLPK